MTTKADAPLILVADDEINTTLMVQHIFEREGYRVERVNNGIAALETAQRLQPDLILLDILMPGMNGFDVLRELRDDERTRAIPTILVTANARQPSDLAHGFDLGADDYIYKPFAHQELVARAVSKIKARKLQDALQNRTEELEALLHVSEHFSQSLVIGELLALSVRLVRELLPCEAAFIYQFDDDGAIAHRHALSADDFNPATISETTLLQQAKKAGKKSAFSVTFDGYEAVVVLLRHANRLLGALAVISLVSYDEDRLRLLTGIGRQAALALHNAQLYEFQLDYAQRLEDKVEERTQQLQSAQQMLIRSEKLASIGHMAASLAHEINTPLMPIKLGLEEIVSQLEETGAQVDSRDLEVINENLERIQRLIRRLLDFTRSGEDGIAQVDLAELLDGIIKLNRKFFEHGRVRVEARIESLPPVMGSRDHLQQVFMNLAVNAQAAMPDGGVLYIEAAADDREITVRFRDTGCGISPENLHKIFDPFFSTKSQGTGLGLFVSHGIIEAHHGRIEVDSQVNSGTEFRVRLPYERRPVLGG
ncbi:MAG: response regulator [bacterium]|nr:response regulator [bacterium]